MPLSALSQIETTGWLVIIVVAAAAIAPEYTWRTLHLSLSHGVSRPTLLLGKFVALLLPALLVVLIPLALATPLTLVFSYLLQSGLHLAQIQPLPLGLAILRTCYGLLPYAALTMFLSIVSRSVIAPIGGGVAFTVVELVLVLGGVPFSAYLPRGLVTILSGLATAGPSPATAAVGIALYVAVLVGLSVLILQRQDLSG